MRDVFPVVEDYGEAEGSGVGDLGEEGGELLQHGVDVRCCVVVPMWLGVG